MMPLDTQAFAYRCVALLFFLGWLIAFPFVAPGLLLMGYEVPSWPKLLG